MSDDDRHLNTHHTFAISQHQFWYFLSFYNNFFTVESCRIGFYFSQFFFFFCLPIFYILSVFYPLCKAYNNFIYFYFTFYSRHLTNLKKSTKINKEKKSWVRKKKRNEIFEAMLVESDFFWIRTKGRKMQIVDNNSKKSEVRMWIDNVSQSGKQ